MKKDKEWLKEEVMNLYPSHSEMYEHPDYLTVEKIDSINNFINLIDQLDEPEVLSLDWIDDNKKDSGVHSIGYYVPIGKLHDLLVPKRDEPEVLSQEWIGENSYDRWMLEGTMDDEDETFVSSYDLQNLIVPKQKKVKVTQKEFNFIKENKVKGENLHDFVHSREVNRENCDRLVEAWLAYPNIEVAEEQKYYVMNKENELILGWSQSAYMTPCIEGYEYMKHTGRENLFQLTEQEIKDYDERYWAFAQEVTE